MKITETILAQLTDTDTLLESVYQAIAEVDQYLDGAMMAGLHEVTIVHGKGTGVLRAGIHQHLKHHGIVKSFRLGQYGEGEDGVTVVTLK